MFLHCSSGFRENLLFGPTVNVPFSACAPLLPLDFRVPIARCFKEAGFQIFFVFAAST